MHAEFGSPVHAPVHCVQSQGGAYRCVPFKFLLQGRNRLEKLRKGSLRQYLSGTCLFHALRMPQTVIRNICSLASESSTASPSKAIRIRRYPAADHSPQSHWYKCVRAKTGISAERTSSSLALKTNPHRMPLDGRFVVLRRLTPPG